MRTTLALISGICPEEDNMFNSPLHYCKVCKQYVALDQSAKECAQEHGCQPEVCPYADLFRPPPAAQKTEPATPERPGKP